MMVIGMVMYQRRPEHDTEASRYSRALAQENPAYQPPTNRGSVRSLVLDSTGTFRPEMASSDNGIAEHSI